jgi:non-lysosomal glucosylceramidase
LQAATLRGEYPLAQVTFQDARLPVEIELEAFTPLVPLDPLDSGLPCAVLRYTVCNRSQEPISLTLVGSLTNPVGGISYDSFGNPKPVDPQAALRTRNLYRREKGLGGLFFQAEDLPATDIRSGNLSLVVFHPELTCKPAWLRAGWYDYLREFWMDLDSDGLLTDLGYQDPSRSGLPDPGSLGVLDRLDPGESGSYTFILSWYFPNRRNSWDDDPTRPLVRNHYATRFGSSWEVAKYVAGDLPRLESVTRQFHAALFGSSLPPEVIEALSVSIVPIRSNTCFWLEDGRFYGYEGCFDDRGCCPGSCTHVWSYAYTLAYLFPQLEREMRRIEFTLETGENGYMFFRTFQTFEDMFVWGDGDTPAAADGQMGSILRVYREWLLSGDREWLAQVWPGVQRAIQYAGLQWDPDGDGVLEGRQHNTYDIEFYGPNPLCGVYYLAALQAVEALAQVMEAPQVALRCREIFERGRQRLDETLWNGEYYFQRLEDLNAHRYQHGQGCLSDQLLGALHAETLGLGEILPASHVHLALQSIYRYNFKPDLSEHANCQRTFALNDEAGLVLCTWPTGGQPDYPFPYSDEVWTGIEYQVAAHLVRHGEVGSGLEIVRAVRARHDGFRRSPWDEVECGHHYARSLSAWLLALALSGLHCDTPGEVLRFDPLVEASTQPDTFRSLWSNGRAWGVYHQQRNPETGQWEPSLQVLGGDLGKTRIVACGKEIGQLSTDLI